MCDRIESLFSDLRAWAELLGTADPSAGAYEHERTLCQTLLDAADALDVYVGA